MKKKMLLISLVALIILGQISLMDKYDIQVGAEDDLIDLLMYETDIQT